MADMTHPLNTDSASHIDRKRARSSSTGFQSDRFAGSGEAAHTTGSSSCSSSMSSAAASRCPAFQNDYQYLPRGVKQDIQDQFGSNIRRGLPVLEFVNKVWGFDPSSIPKRPGGSQYTLNRSPLREYSDAIGPACIKPLVAILQDLLNQLFPGQSLLDEFTADNPQSRAVNARFINILDQPLLAVGEFQAFGPELGWGTPAGIQRQVWSWYLVYVGVTKTASIPMTLKADMNIPMGMFTEAQSEISEQDSPDPLTTLSDDEIRAVRHLICMMHGSPRTYASGFSISDMNITLWYGDRMGVISSRPFDLVKEAHLLVLVIAAMGSASVHQLGSCPYLNFPPGFSRLGGTTLGLPKGQARDAAGETLGELTFEVDNTKRIYSKRETLGRGTIVVYVKATDDSLEICGDQPLIAKMAWISPERNSEDGYIRTVRRKLRENGAEQYLKHIVDLKCSVERTMREIKLPRAFMADEYQDNGRIFRLMIVKEYEDINSVNSAEEFKTVFIDALRAHHWAWKMAGVLHCDISVGNIMLYREHGHVVGVLCDWDLARFAVEDSRQGGEHQQIKSTNMRRQPNVPADVSSHYGTVPFMAHELLSPFERFTRTYSHDLESFYYLLVWFCVVFDPVTHRYGSMPEWETGDEIRMWTFKHCFLTDRKIYEDVVAAVHPDYRSLVVDWMDPLATRFRRVTLNRTQYKWLPQELEHARMKENAEAVEAMQAKLDKLEAEGVSITYDDFATVLGEASVDNNSPA